MKNLLFMFTFCIIVIQGVSQTDYPWFEMAEQENADYNAIIESADANVNYQPMLGDTNVWTYSGWPWDFVNVISTKDSTYQNADYKNILHERRKGADEWGSTGLLREDTIEQQIWYIEPDDSLERIIYDFSLGEGDSIWLQYNKDALGYMLEDGWYFIDSIRIRTYFETERRVYYLDNPINIDLEGSNSKRPYIQWIEGVGSNLHPTYYIIKDCAADLGGIHFFDGASIICAFQNNLHTYQDPIFFPPYAHEWSCFRTGTSIDQSLHDKFKVFPNPATTKLTIEIPLGKSLVTIVNIYNSNGVLLKSINTKDEHYTIDVSNFKSGVYVVSLIQENIVRTQKLVLTK